MYFIYSLHMVSFVKMIFILKSVLDFRHTVTKLTNYHNYPNVKGLDPDMFSGTIFQDFFELKNLNWCQTGFQEGCSRA